MTAYIGLGANLGDAATAVERAIRDVGQLAQSRVTARSSLYRSAPLDADGPDYVNAVAAVETRLSAPALLAGLQQIEDAAGRLRPYQNAPRTLDLDLLLYGSARIDSPLLSVPHPRMNQRAFVLVPLAEIAAQLVTPAQLCAVAGQTLRPL